MVVQKIEEEEKEVEVEDKTPV